MGKSDGGPIGCQVTGVVLNTGARANPRAGRAIAAVATIPAPFAAPTMNRRRVTVSPSYAPGMLRSSVYLGFLVLRRSGKGSAASGPWIEQGRTGYRQQRDDRHEVPLSGAGAGCIRVPAPQPIATAPASQISSARPGSPSA